MLKTLASGPLSALVPSNLDPWDAWLGSFATGTAGAYRRDADQWTAWCGRVGTDPMQAREGHVTAWVAELRRVGRADATIARKLAALASLYSWARRNQVTDADPLAGVRRPQAHSDDADRLGLDREQARTVLTTAAGYSPRAHALTALLLFTGVRVSEAINADLDDLSDIRGHHVLRVTGKGNRPRTVPLPPPVRHALDVYLGTRADGPMFTTSSGQRWDRNGAHDTITRIGRRAGITLYPHLLRHTAASLALDADAPLDRVQSLLGHADPRTTMRYAHARQRLDTSAAYDLARWLAEDGE